MSTWLSSSNLNLCKRGFCILAVGVAAASIFEGDEYTQYMSTTARCRRSRTRRFERVPKFCAGDFPFLVSRQRHRGGARVFDALDLEPMEDATDEETYNLLLQLKELRCARLQVRVTHVLARSHLLPLTPRCTPTLSLLRRR